MDTHTPTLFGNKLKNRTEDNNISAELKQNKNDVQNVSSIRFSEFSIWKR